MNYRNIIRCKAKELTKNLTFSDIPINPIELIKDKYNIKLVIDDLCGEEGYTFYDRKNNRYMICIDNNIKNKGRLNFTIAHEVGHIYLGHFENQQGHTIEMPKILDTYANIFAAEIMMPDHLLFDRTCEMFNDDYLALKFGVSIEALRIRYNEYS